MLCNRERFRCQKRCPERDWVCLTGATLHRLSPWSDSPLNLIQYTSSWPPSPKNSRNYRKTPENVVYRGPRINGSIGIPLLPGLHKILRRTVQIDPTRSITVLVPSFTKVRFCQLQRRIKLYSKIGSTRCDGYSEERNTVCVTFLNTVANSAVLPVFGLRVYLGKLLLETSTQSGWPLLIAIPVRSLSAAT